MRMSNGQRRTRKLALLFSMLEMTGTTTVIIVITGRTIQTMLRRDTSTQVLNVDHVKHQVVWDDEMRAGFAVG